MVGTAASPGITPRALERLFALLDGDRAKGALADVAVRATMVELYNDGLEDLLWRADNPRARVEDAPRLEIKKDDKG